jgi:hypothetical protein
MIGRMRPLAPLALASLLACSERATAPDPAPPRTRPLAQDGSAARAVTSAPDRVRVQLDLAAVRAAVQAYHAERAAWPGTLGELGVEGISYPADLAYDPASGTVTSRTYPTL